MPDIQVEGPNGQMVAFPAGTPRATMEAAMRAKFGGGDRPGSFSDRAGKALDRVPVVGEMYRAGQRRGADVEARSRGRVDAAASERQAGKERATAARANPAALGSRIVPDLLAPAQNALADISGGYRDFQNAEAPRNALAATFDNDRQRGVNRTLGGVGGLILSPMTGPVNALMGPVARGMERVGIGDEEKNRESINTALMGMRPGPRTPRPAPAPRATPTDATNTLARRGRVDVQAARQTAADMRAAGVEPNFTAVAGDRGQRVVRAVGARNAAAGEALTTRARQSAANTKPEVIDRTRQMVNDPRTTRQMADDADAARGQSAQINYGPAYDAQLPLEAETLQALGSETGQTALRLARRSAADLPDGAPVLAEIDQILAGNATQASGRTIDYVRQVMNDMARGFAARPEMGRRAVGVAARRDQLDASLDAAPGIRQARAEYRDQSRAIGVLRNERGARQDFSSTPAADYQAWFNDLPAQAQAAERAAIRQDILDTLGDQRANTYGTIDELASAQYTRDNLRTAFGAQEADNYIANLNARLAQTRADQVVAPGAGSRTAVLDEDMQQLGAVAGTMRNAVQGRWGQVAADWWRRRGIPDNVAQEITARASDPAQLDAVLAEIEAAMGRNVAADFAQLIRSLSRPEVVAPALQSSGAVLQNQ